MKEEENCGCSTTTVCRKIKSEDLRVRKKIKCSKMVCGDGSFLFKSIVSIFHMGQNTTVKFPDLSGWLFQCFLENNLQHVTYK